MTIWPTALARVSRWRRRSNGESSQLLITPSSAQPLHCHRIGDPGSVVLRTLATNAIVTWTTEYYGLSIAALRRAGRHIDDEVLAHIWPSHYENVNFYGTHSVDVDGELAKLDADGYRPLRAPTHHVDLEGDSHAEHR
ncbi:transposase [Kribbella sp. NBC_01245]|uniref:Tn3 family transposase n=1 Tax=Kribbella sp. NBC_01245 TaxID=2903578 RepID=UPI002E2818E9|nr:Tn3 family transposase [Kribbella sp. NBC_01245]